ncbi:MAG: GTPase ObgE [Firmicutes bacterium]|nr:GTPase ObgE [Bacillota bacterium]MCD7783762.1 GTPase ObgE [Bacillota bacterium]
MFIDKVTIYVKAGDGGDGAVSFHREKYVAKGGPDGGDGGRGGNVVFTVDEGETTLLRFRYKKKFVAVSGEGGKANNMHGKSAPDLEIPVPQGTIIRSEDGAVIHDMSDGKPFTLCRGGRGGWGNRHFATPTRQVPRFAKKGTKGEERNITLELKMIADVGLVGMPSVGKSSILAAISAAHPKIADYHFTTLSPSLGVVKLGDERGDDVHGFVAADIPGLIEGAADGAGLGHDFLRHIDRCRMLAHVVDIASVELRDPTDDIEKINAELEKWSPELASRPQLIVANKCDVLDRNTADIEKFEGYVSSHGWEVVYVSAATGEGINEMVNKIAAMLRDLPPVTVYEPEIDAEPEIKASSTEFTVRREGKGYVVEGEWLFDLLGRVDLSDREGVSYFGRVLTKYGVIQKLEEAGCHDGDTVSIYDFEFDFVK